MSMIVHDELLDSLAELRQLLPTMRLGQLVANMATVARGPVPGAIWDVEDEELMKAMRWQRQQLANRNGAEAAEPNAAPDRDGN